MTQTPAAFDPQRMEELGGGILGFLGGTMVAGSIFVGDQLGLYKQLDGAGAVTSDELADKSGLSERWVREWLHHQASAGIIDHKGDGKFELSPEAALMLADDSSPASMIGFFSFFPVVAEIFENLPESFRTGIGRKYDDHGAVLPAAMQRATGGTTGSFVDVAIPALDGVVAKLESGAKVADIGCGAGGRMIALGEKHPASSFHGYDTSVHALTLANQNLKKSGLSNVSFHNPDNDPLPPTGEFDLVTFGDVVHDLAHPVPVLTAARNALKDDGTMLVIDFAAAESLEDNLAHPMAPMFYGFSMLMCMASGLSEEGGAGIGPMGLSESRLRGMTEEAGFTRFGTLPDIEDPLNAYYEIRP